MSKTKKKKKIAVDKDINLKNQEAKEVPSNETETTISQIAVTEEVKPAEIHTDKTVEESKNEDSEKSQEQNNEALKVASCEVLENDKKVKAPLEQLEPLHFGKELKKRIGSHNPAILKFVAAVPILGAATALKNGILISIVLILTVLLLNMIMYPIDKYIKPEFKHVTKFVLAGIIVTPFLMLSDYFVPNITTACEIYLPLTAICAIPMVETKYCGKKHGFSRTVLMALVNGIGFTFVALLFAIIRETLGKAMLYEKAIPFMNGVKLPFIVYPAGAFILLGFLAALWRKMFGVKGDKEE